MGVGMLIFAVFGVAHGVTKIDFLQIASLIAIIYSSWAIGQFFDRKKLANYFKAFAAYVLGMFSCVFFAIAAGTIIDTITR
jgi:uncharacterized membrane protein AbrB (regulator of aidB expression)